MGTRVYVGRFPYDTRERDIEKFFKGYGRIREILMKDGFAFVEFDSRRDAEDAVYDLNNKELVGERVAVELARRSSKRYPTTRYERSSRSSRRLRNPNWMDKYGAPRNTEYRVIVENLSSKVSWQDLKDVMRRAGEVTFADAHKKERHMGVVDFASYSDMKKAMETLDGHELNGRKIKLIEDKESSRRAKRSRSRSGSKSRSRSDSRSRSRSRSRARKSRSRSRSRSRDRKSRSRDRRSRSSSRKSRSRDRRSRSSSRKSRSRDRRSRSASRSMSVDKERDRSASRDSRARSASRTPSRDPGAPLTDSARGEL